MSSLIEAFSEHWLAGHLRDHDTLSRSRLRRAYACTYLTKRTLSHFRTILDAGCGGGYLLWFLTDRRWKGRYVGCDWSPTSLTAARSHFPGGEYLQCDLRHLPFEKGAFDLVYARDSVIHSPEPRQTLLELRRVSHAALIRVRIADVDEVFTARYREHAAVTTVHDDTRTGLFANAWQQGLEFRDYIEARHRGRA
jgi:SAM-dependent methyltransferase